MGKAHGVGPATPVSASQAEQVARVMSALGTGSRVRILACLREENRSVGTLAELVDMAQPAVSHQLRVLRDLGLVVGIRDGRKMIYGLHDPHVAALLDEALRHVQHLTSHEEGTTMAEHEHDGAHTHEHSHGDTSHEHAHTGHDHDHVEHDHEHDHGDGAHSHPHVHEAGQESAHEHAHA